MINIAQASTAIGTSAKAETTLNAAGVKGGLVVILGCDDPELLTGLRANDRYVVQGLDNDAGKVENARKAIKAKAIYGKISAAVFDGNNLPYIDNLVNLIVVNGEWQVSRKEILRVLTPLGVALINGEKIVKPWPSNIDDWPQYLNKADNNAVAKDAVVGPPRHLQWVDEPAWSRSHIAIPSVCTMVSSKGRLFTIEDRATSANPMLPSKWKLIARDAFNGMPLWSYDIAEWENQLRYIKGMAVQLQDRCAVVGDILYFTPGINAPITAFDAATGKILKVYKGTEKTQELSYDDGILFCSIGDPMNAEYSPVDAFTGHETHYGGVEDKNAPFGGTGFSGHYPPMRRSKDTTVCDIVALEAATGRELWRIPGVQQYVACTMAIKGEHAVYQTENGLFCIHPKTGKKMWSIEKKITSQDGTQPNSVIITDKFVFAQEGRAVHAYDIKDGSEKWSGGIQNTYKKSADLFFAQDKIWTVKLAGLNPETGKAVTQIIQRMTQPMGHDRCYRNFITERYYINSKTGGSDFLDLASGEEFPNFWTRGTCGMGVLPCNGLLYKGPYACQCSENVMVQNFDAYYTEPNLKKSGQPIPVERKARLEKGPAFGAITDAPAEADAWPTFRHDGTRGGCSSAAVSAQLAPLWTAKVKTRASAPTVAGGKVFIADIDAHTVVALDAAGGKILWEYTADGRVDSPPTYHKGRILFGDRAGWMYCLRASDGALAWRFKDLPDKLLGAFGEMESAWPVNGSVLVKDDIVYFNAGRNSFLDGGIFLYGLSPETGAVKYSAGIYGPFLNTGFPDYTGAAFKPDIMVTDGTSLFIRHKAFNPDLSDATSVAKHINPSAGFLEDMQHHRTYWSYGTGKEMTGSM